MEQDYKYFSFVIGQEEWDGIRISFESEQMFRYRVLRSDLVYFIHRESIVLLKYSEGRLEVYLTAEGNLDLDRAWLREYLGIGGRQWELMRKQLVQAEDVFRKDLCLEIVDNSKGLRIFKQDQWECLLCSVAAYRCSLPQAKIAIERLCQKYGKEPNLNKITGYSIPRPNSLKDLTVKEFYALGFGSNADTIYRIVHIFDNKDSDMGDILWGMPSVRTLTLDRCRLMSGHELDLFLLDDISRRVLRMYFEGRAVYQGIEDYAGVFYLAVTLQYRRHLKTDSGYFSEEAIAKSKTGK